MSFDCKSRQTKLSRYPLLEYLRKHVNIKGLGDMPVHPRHPDIHENHVVIIIPALGHFFGMNKGAPPGSQRRQGFRFRAMVFATSSITMGFDRWPFIPASIDA